MNQDKIKQAFEEWRTGRNYTWQQTYSLGVSEEGWLAACEWLMSQGSEGFDEWADKNQINNPWKRIRYEDAWVNIRLSCAKELAEKDARIKELEGELSRQYELVSKIGMELNTRKQAELACKK
jgi:hypothetical protein